VPPGGGGGAEKYHGGRRRTPLVEGLQGKNSPRHGLLVSTMPWQGMPAPQNTLGQSSVLARH